MRLRHLGFPLAIAILSCAPGSAQQPAPPAPPPPQEQVQKSQTVIPVQVNLVDVLFTVLDRRNKLVPSLEKPDFKVLDDNVSQDIHYFSRQSDLPLRIGMLLDTSNSIRDRIKFEQDAANNFLFSVLRRGKDEAFVMTFDDEPQVVQTFTPDTANCAIRFCARARVAARPFTTPFIRPASRN